MRKRLLHVLLGAHLLVLLTATHAPGAEDMTVINARLGVAKAPRFKTESWAQLTVTLRNKGGQADAEVLYTPLGAGFARTTTLFRKRIPVPAQSEIEIAFPVLVQMDEKFLVELFVNGVAVDKQQFNASAVSIADPLVLILDDGATAYSYFKDMRIENRKVSLSIAQSRDMPEYWEILDSLSAIILGDVDPRKFQQSQIETLRAWVEGGGTLIVSTDERWTRLRGSFVEGLLPVRMYGTRPIDAMESLGVRYGKPLVMHEDLQMCEAFPSSGNVLVSLQGLPLLAYHKLGLGTVVFSAVRLDSQSVVRWPGLAAMWEEIFTLRERPVEVRRTTLEAQREQMLSNVAGLPVPEPQFVAKLLLGYIVIVAAIFVAFRFRRRLEWAWCSLLLVAPVAAGIYHAKGKAARQEFKSTLNEISVVRMSGQLASEPPRSNLGWIESFHSIYSSEKASYNLRAETPDTIIAQGASTAETTETAVPAINTVAGDVVVAENILVNEGGLQSFKSFATRAYDGRIASGLAWGPQGLEGEVRNELGFPIEDAMVLFNRQLVEIKTLQPGDSRRVRIADPRNAQYTPFDAMGGAALDITRKQVIQALFTPLSNYNPAQDQPLFIGWAPFAVAQVNDDSGRLRRKGLTLLLVSLPCRRTEGDVLIPKGTCIARVASALTFRQGRWVPMAGFAAGGETDVEFRIPPDVRDVTVEEIRGRFEIENPGNDMQTKLEAFDWSMGAWVPIEAKTDFVLKDPWRFVLRPIGRVKLRIGASSLPGKLPVGDAPSLRAYKWLVRDIDIELRGKLG